MARYTQKLVGALRQRYENTNQSMHSIAAEFDIGTTTLRRLVNSEGWSKRSKRPRGLPVAMQLLEEAKALAANAAVLPPPERGRQRRPSAAVLSDKNADAEHRLCCEAVRPPAKRMRRPSSASKRWCCKKSKPRKRRARNLAASRVAQRPPNAARACSRP